MTTKSTLQPRYNACCYSAQLVITLPGRWIPLKNDGVILNHLTYYEFYASVHNVSLIDDFSGVKTPLFAVFKLVLYMLVA